MLLGCSISAHVVIGGSGFGVVICCSFFVASITLPQLLLRPLHNPPQGWVSLPMPLPVHLTGPCGPNADTTLAHITREYSSHLLLRSVSPACVLYLRESHTASLIPPQLSWWWACHAVAIGTASKDAGNRALRPLLTPPTSTFRGLSLAHQTCLPHPAMLILVVL